MKNKKIVSFDIHDLIVTCFKHGKSRVLVVLTQRGTKGKTREVKHGNMTKIMKYLIKS